MKARVVLQARWWLVAWGLLSASAAQSQVYEIAPEGTMMVRDGGGPVQWHAPQSPSAPSAFSSPIPPPPDSLSKAVVQAADRHRISPDLLEALVWQESRWHINALSPKGARGLTQLMPGTARTLGVDARDPIANLDGGAHYLRQLLDRFGGDVELALAAYNAGPRRVERAGSVPAITETRNYVASIMDRLGSHALQTCAKSQNCPEAVP